MQTYTGTVSKSTMGKLLKDGVDSRFKITLLSHLIFFLFFIYFFIFLILSSSFHSDRTPQLQ